MFGWKKKTQESDKAQSGAAVAEKETPEFKVKVLERKGCTATLAVTVPPADVAAAVEEAFKDIQKKAKIPGFRPGKAPMDMVREGYRGHALEHGINNLLRQTVHDALDQEKISPLTVPAVDKVDYNEGKSLKYEVKVECAPEVTLKDYKGLAITKKLSPVLDADVEEKLKSLRENNAKLAPAGDGPITDAHFAVVDYDATLDGKSVDGGKASDQLIEMSAPQALAGFNDGLKGMKKGETKAISVAFPTDHPNKALAGKSVIFNVTVKDVKEKQLPAADDEFAKDLGVASLAELTQRLRSNLEAERTRVQREDMEHQVIDALLSRHTFDVPPSQVDQRAKDLTERMKNFLMSRGASAADWSKNEASMTEKNRVEAERQVRLSYLLMEIAKIENVDVTEADLAEAVDKSLQGAAPGKVDEMRKWLDDRREGLRAQLKEEKLFNLLIEHAKVTEQKAS